MSDEDRSVVEDCGEKDIAVTPANLEQMKEIAQEQKAQASDSVVKLFKS